MTTTVSQSWRTRHRHVAGKLGPGDEAQFVRLHQAGVCWDDANAETVGAAFSCGNAAPVNVISVAVSLAALIQNRRGRITEIAVVHFAVIGFDAYVLRIDGTEMHARADLQGFTD